jgi:hypothetical protein
MDCADVECVLPYPHLDLCSALHADGRAPIGEGKQYVLSVVDCGFLLMPPACWRSIHSLAFLQVSPGPYRVLVTLADVSDAHDLPYP